MVTGLSPCLPGRSSSLEIDFLFLTHAHIDHISRIAELISQWFMGEIICTHPTRSLLLPLLEDALGFTDFGPRGKENTLAKIDELCYGFEFNEDCSLKNGIGFRFGRAGHILGYGFIRFALSPYFSLVFSGDLGCKYTPILCDPDISRPCDLLILESTYGNRLHEDRQMRVDRLGRVLWID